MRVFAQAIDLADDPARIDEYLRRHLGPDGAVMAQALWLAGCEGGTEAQRAAAHAVIAATFDGLTMRPA